MLPKVGTLRAGAWMRGRHPGFAWLLLSVAVTYSFWWTLGKTEDFQDADFGVYYHAAQAVVRGESPYVVGQSYLGTYVYAPAFAFLFIPFQWLPYIWACRLWLALNWGMSLGCVVLAWRLLRRNESERPVPALYWLAAIPLVEYFWANLRVGQTGALLTFCCLGWAVLGQGGRPIRAGLLLAGACALKVAPALLIPFMFMRRDWRALAGLVAGCVMFLAIPVPWVGFDGTVRLHSEWARHTLHTQIPEQTFRPGNQSLLGQLARLPGISNGTAIISAENLERLHRVYPILVVLPTAVVYVWLFWRGQRLSDMLYLAILFVFMTLVHPRAWRCNFVALILPAMILADVVLRRAPGWKWALAVLGGTCLVAILPGGTASSTDWSWLTWLIQGKHFWAATVMAGVCVWVGERYNLTSHVNPLFRPSCDQGPVSPNDSRFTFSAG
jgi:hypothetical protein